MEDQIMCFDMKNNLDTNCCHHPPPHSEEVDNLEKVVLEQLEPLRHSVATVEKIGTRSKTAKCLLRTCKDILFLRECFIRKYSKAKESVHRVYGSTVLDISIPPLSSKPVPLSLSRFPLSKTPKQVFF